MSRLRKESPTGIVRGDRYQFQGIRFLCDRFRRIRNIRTKSKHGREKTRPRGGPRGGACRLRSEVTRLSVKPKFFCEFCGTEVGQHDKVCSHCGKFFASVKCPACGFSGDSRIFRDGCPACGYAFPGQRKGSGNFRAKKKPADDATDPLPWWIYAASLLLLFAFILLIVLRK